MVCVNPLLGCAHRHSGAWVRVRVRVRVRGYGGFVFGLGVMEG